MKWPGRVITFHLLPAHPSPLPCPQNFAPRYSFMHLYGGSLCRSKVSCQERNKMMTPTNQGLNLELPTWTLDGDSIKSPCFSKTATGSFYKSYFNLTKKSLMLNSCQYCRFRFFSVVKADLTVYLYYFTCDFHLIAVILDKRVTFVYTTVIYSDRRQRLCHGFVKDGKLFFFK